MSITPICFVDSETDGVHPDRKPWEIALIRRDDEGEREVSFFVEIDLRTADPFGLRVGRFYDRHPLGRAISEAGHPLNWAPSEAKYHGDYLVRERAAQIVARMTHGAHLVGAVPNFDSEVFDRLLRDHGLCPSWHYHLIDVEALAVGYAAGAGKDVLLADGTRGPLPLPWKSDSLMQLIGVQPPTEDERHTALGDARFARAVYDRVTGPAA